MKDIAQNMDNICTRPVPPFQVRTAGLIRKNPYHSTPGTRQNDVMLTVFLAGQGTYHTGTGRQVVEGGMVGLVPPEEPGILMAHPGDPYTHYYCRFNGTYAVHLARQIIAAHGGRFFHAAHADDIADLVRRMGPIFRASLPDQMGPAELLLAEALVRLARPESPEGSAITPAALEEYLRNHLAEPNDLGRMAEHFGISRAGLCRLARKRCRRTILQMSEAMKIDWAKTLLHSGSLSVRDVALRVGYSDPLYFSRVFRKHAGTSPRTWARRGNCR